jgi:hypothetical protein
MSETTHTPGPWRAVPNPMRDDGLFVVRDRRAGEIENYPGELPPAIVGFQLPHADAYLIAAAPDMLAKLREIHAGMVCSCRLQHFVDGPVPCETCQIGAVVAKAEGR